MKLKSRSIAATLAPIVAAGAALAGCSNERRTEAAPPAIVSDVAVLVAQRTTIPDYLEAVGTVRAAQTSQIASQATGNIVEMRVHEGDRVQSGQVLAVIDDTQPRAAVERATAAVTAAQKEVSAAESEFALADATLKRYQQLYEKKSVSPQEFDEIQARHQSAEARRDAVRAEEAQASAALTQARTSFGYTQVRAPFAGVVTEKKADVGALASPGLPMFTLEQAGRYRLEATVDEIDIHLVRVGQALPVLIEALGSSTLSGKVVQIVPAADPASRSFLVKIEMPADPRLRSGLFGRAHLPRGERSALMIPQSAIVEHGQLRGIYVLDANRIAELRYVTLGIVTGQSVEILSGLQEGEKFIAAPGNRELSGKQIAGRP
jgi:RND family efflux transporter MFP subunit